MIVKSDSENICVARLKLVHLYVLNMYRKKSETMSSSYNHLVGIHGVEPRGIHVFVELLKSFFFFLILFICAAPRLPFCS